MKKLSLLLPLLFLFCTPFQAWSKTDSLVPYYAKSINHALTTVANSTVLPHDTCLEKKFSIVFHLIQDSAYTLPNNTQSAFYSSNSLATYSLSDYINKLNETFAPLCVSFENCKVEIIPNYFYGRWTVGTTDSVVLGNYYTPKTINVYIPYLILNPQQDHSFAYTTPFPSGTSMSKDYIVIQKGFALSNNAVNFLGSILLHAFGHFFGLPHTYAEISASLDYGPSTELTNGSNCTTHGDGFCDTDADPYPAGFNNSVAPVPICNYKFDTGVMDPTGNYYTPPVDNIMSNYACRCRFTPEQYNFMAKIIMTKRLYLH